MKAKKKGRPPVKDKRIAVTFTALESKVKDARKQIGLGPMNKKLEECLYGLLER